MAVTNHERVGKALELLRAGLAPFVEREVQEAVRAGSVNMETLRRFEEDPLFANKPVAQWDTAGLLRLMWEVWKDVFRGTLGFAERSLVSGLREWRNKWAHQEPFSTDDAYRALDSAARLLSAISAPQVEELERMKMELLRLRFDEQVRGEKRKAGGSLVEAAVSGALKPWREVVTPHPDVASGRYQQAEFAADLWKVFLGKGTDEKGDEYRDPVEFFRRTYLTESLHRLLVNAVQRLTGVGGDPVVQRLLELRPGQQLIVRPAFSGSEERAQKDLQSLRGAALGVASRHHLPLEIRVFDGALYVRRVREDEELSHRLRWRP